MSLQLPCLTIMGAGFLHKLHYRTVSHLSPYWAHNHAASTLRDPSP